MVLHAIVFWSQNVDNAQVESPYDEILLLIRRIGVTKIEL